MTQQKLSFFVSTRLNKAHRIAFMRKAKKEYNADVSTALRELIIAFIEDRVVIKPQTKEFLK